MPWSKNLFENITDSDRGDISFRDNSKGKTICIGTIFFTDSCDITNVYLVKNLKYNLLSITQLCDAGLEVTFKKRVHI